MEKVWTDFIKTHNRRFIKIAMSVYSADKRIPRSYFDDSWTRCFDINIPVIETEKWNEVKKV